MKLRLLLFASVSLNLLLGAVILRARLGHAASVQTPVVAPRAEVSAASASSVEQTQAPPAVTVVYSPIRWSELRSDDFHKYAVNLRGVGCPDATIRDIIIAEINRGFAGRVRKLVDGVSGRFWELMLDNEELEKVVQEKQEELRNLDHEREEMFKAVLGADDPAGQLREAEAKEDEDAQWAQTLDFLPADKLAQFLEIKESIGNERSELAESSKEFTQKKREEKYRALDLEEQQRIKALFTPAEWDEYSLRTSSAARVRSDLLNIPVSEDEIRAVAMAKMTSRTNAREAEERIRALLGEDRYAAFQRASDNAYRQALRVTARFDLPEEVAAQVYQIRKEAEAFARKIRNDQNLPTEQRQAALQAARAETENAISAALGSRAFAAYQRHSRDWFLRLTEEVR